MRKFLYAALALGLAGCGGSSSVTGPSGADGELVSALGYRIERADYRGAVTQAHADLADRWWGELMRDLQAAGYPPEQADPANIHAATIKLFEPQDADHCFKVSGRMVCGAYWPYTLLVPGTYAGQAMLGRRPNFQPLKHEMTHHWCIVVLGRDCIGASDKDHAGHVWLMPNGQNIWDLQWR
jgi:hypothetical protein